MTEVVPADHSVLIPARRAPLPVHAAVRDQLIADIGEDRLSALYAVVDTKTFNAALHWLSGEKRSSAATKHRYAEDVAAFAAWVAAHRNEQSVALLDVLDFDTVTVWTVWARSRGMAVGSRRRILAAVSSLFGKCAVPQGWAVSNPVSFDQHAPAKGTSDNGRPAGATRVLPTEDIARLAAAAESPEEHAVVELLYEHGLRESEVIALDVENIDRTAAPLLRFRRKGGQWKNREIPPNLLGHIAALLDGRTSGPLLVDPKTGRRRNRHQIIDLTRRLARRGGVPNPNGVTPHTLRAAAITELLNSGAPLHEVQAWADHKHADTTRGYWERSHGLQRDAALTAQLSARLAGQE